MFYSHCNQNMHCVWNLLKETVSFNYWDTDAHGDQCLYQGLHSQGHTPWDWFNIQMTSYQYEGFHCGDKSFFYHLISMIEFPILLRWNLYILPGWWCLNGVNAASDKPWGLGEMVHCCSTQYQWKSSGSIIICWPSLWLLMSWFLKDWAISIHNAVSTSILPYQFLNSSPPEQNGCHSANDIFRSIFVNEKFCILIKISLNFIAKCPNYNNPALL